MHDGSFYDWFQRRPLLLDVPVAVVLALTTAAPFTGSLEGWWTLLGLPVLLLVVRRTRPALAFAAVSLVLAVRLLPEDQVLPGDLAFVVAVYSLAAYEPRRFLRLAGIAVASLGAALAAVRFTGYDGSELSWSPVIGIFVGCFGSALSAWFLGDLKRTRLQRIAVLQERARHLEREREQELQLAAQQERASIAREMHDVVAHALSVIIVQSDGAAYAAERRPADTLAQSVAALQTIGATARDALTETRRLVGVLRDPASGAELAPTGGLAQVDELVERVRAAGVDVALHWGQAPARELAPVPVGVDLAAYRVVQESLTNVMKHAGPGAAVDVTIEQDPSQLRISVRDNGIGAGSLDDGRGHGLPGMRERVSVHDGVLTAGPGPGGGWEVRATLPVSVAGPVAGPVARQASGSESLGRQP